MSFFSDTWRGITENPVAAISTGGLAAPFLGRSSRKHEDEKAAHESQYNDMGQSIFNNAFGGQEYTDAREQYLKTLEGSSPTADQINQEASRVAGNAAYMAGGSGQLNPQQKAELAGKYTINRSQQVAEDKIQRDKEYFDTIANQQKLLASLQLQGQSIGASTTPSKPSLLDQIGLGGIL